jgi:putative nucleotidyltransferase with HDIG domain
MNNWDEVRRASSDQILSWAETQPWAQAMARCRQDARWHAEGDVWTHTRMVAAEVERLPEWPSLNRDTQLKLLFTALFHDAGKPETTAIDPATGRMHSPKHAMAGVEIGRNVLRDLGYDLGVREEISALIRYHARPAFLLEKSDPAQEVIWLSWLVNPRLLYLFALADTRGRRTREMNRPEDNIHLWKMLAQENGCFEQPYAFANDHARFLFYRESLASLHYTPREEYRCTVTLMSGLPGSGKDTWLARHRPGLPVVSLDDLRATLDVDAAENQGEVIQAAREVCREHLRAKRDFAFNATNTMRQTRKRWIDLFADYGARIEVVYVEPPLPLIFQQNECRSKPVPRRVIQTLVDKLEPPTWAEAHSLRLIGGSGQGD